MSFACWIPKAKHTHLEYVIIIGFPPQLWFHECATILRYSTSPVLLLLFDAVVVVVAAAAAAVAVAARLERDV